ncbi:hypothetical protein GGH17_002494 [Coemansia sp. RSA 788]|nr:hypothetical protein GGH17_002494 [Coemansia sp. RSA 788]KAJ2177202.1 hypothetical protein EV181_006612 [Coemansia sp. RSA 532]
MESDDSSSSDAEAGASAESTGKPNLPLIIGIAAGVIILVGLISWGVLCYCTRKKKRQMNAGKNPHPDYVPENFNHGTMYRESNYAYEDSYKPGDSYNLDEKFSGAIATGGGAARRLDDGW